MSLRIPRRQYADLYGPTTGDRVRLADTELLIRIERDLTTPGEEAKFGGGKVLRDGMGQSARATRADGVLDVVITNAVVVDHWGIVKADIGVREGRIVGVGKAGNPDLMAGVTPGMVVGAGTEVIAGEGKIVTAGGLDTHIHFICPQLVTEAISAGLTTMVGGGTGPATGTNATTCTPGEWNLHRMLEAAEAFPVNLGFLGKGNASAPDPLREQIAAGAIGLKLHEDWGTTPAAIDTDTLNEAGFVEDSIRAFKGRTIHTYHTEGAGGGHAPDIIRVCGEPNCLPSSTNPTMPFTVNTMDVHHDLGAISMLSSDSQAMGRIAEVITRTWQTADKMKKQRGALPGDGRNDNVRAKRYVAKYTINPAISHGIAHEVGSIEAGKLADLVVWKPAFFGVKPELVLKSGLIVTAAMGDPNASIPTPQPVRYRPMFASYGGAVYSTSMTFVSKAALEDGVPARLGLRKMISAARGCRGLTKAQMVNNSYCPRMEVDAETYEVRADGQLLTCEPARVLPMAQRYYLF